jgi:hypothetical protein
MYTITLMIQYTFLCHLLIGLRLLGIGRNQYIDLMNQSRSGRKLFRKRNAREFLPTKPVQKMVIEPWWL